MMGKMDVKDWYDVYGRLTHWTLELEKSEDDSMQEVLSMQFEDANRQFGKFVENNYEEWAEQSKKSIAFNLANKINKIFTTNNI